LRGTILLTISSMAIGVTLGIVVAIMRLSPSPVLRYSAFAYIWFFRAVPRLVLCVLFGTLGTLWHKIGVGVPFDQEIGSIFGVHNLDLKIANFNANDLLSGFVAGMLALALSETAYMAEIVRAGIQSIDVGQTEAAAALGLSRAQTLRRIVLPQAMRVIIPPTGNEVISMLKTTSLVTAVPYAFDLYSIATREIAARTFEPVPLALVAVAWYLLMTSILMVGQYYLERYYSRGASRKLTTKQLEALAKAQQIGEAGHV
jgi:polar amino acid transport system permease protein